MYCQSCGSSVKQNLSYCNACGARLNNAKDRESHTPQLATPDSLIWAIVAVTIAGLGIVIGLMSVMKNELHFDDGITLGFASLVLLLIVAIDTTFIWQFLRRNQSAQETLSTARLRELITRELNAAPPRALPEPVPSVTEHTTRQLENSRQSK
jgi:hypothetical protein